MARIRTRHWTLLGLALSAVMLAFAFDDVDFRELWRIVMSADPLLVGVVLAMNFGLIALRGFRWREIIGATTTVSFRDATQATLIGCLASSLLPARGGEVVRVLVLGQKARVSRTMLAGALVVDHMVEGAAMVLVMLALPFLLTTPAWMKTATAAVSAVTVAVGVFAWLVMGAHQAEWLQKLPHRFQERVAATLHRLNDGFATLKSLPRLTYMLGLALAIWLFQGLMIALSLSATGIDLHFHQALFVLMAVNVAVLIPGAPSSVGPFEFAAVLALGSLGVAKTPALTVALLYHFVQVIPTVVAGLVALSISGLGIKDLGRQDPVTPAATSSTTEKV